MEAVQSNFFIRCLQKTSSSIDSLIEKLGIVVAWLSLAMVLVTFMIVVLRYGFSLGWIAMQESVLYMHAILFMLGCSYALKHNEHVRVDVFYRRFSKRKQALVNLFGHFVFLWPVALFILINSFDYVSLSWKIKEASQEAGGLPFVFILKTLIPLLSISLLLQSISEICKHLLTVFKQGDV